RARLHLGEELVRLGASTSASCCVGSSAPLLSASGLSDNFEQWFAVTNDVLLNPSFPADELNRLKQRLKTQLRQQRASPSFLSNERFSRAVYAGHPAAVVSSTVASIDAMTPEALAKWHRERYAPQNAILGITGDVRASELVPKLEKWLTGWKKTALKEVLPPNPKVVPGRRVLLVDRPNSVQTSVMLGNIAIDRRDPDFIPVSIMNHMLGGGSAARLFLN